MGTKLKLTGKDLNKEDYYALSWAMYPEDTFKSSTQMRDNFLSMVCRISFSSFVNRFFSGATKRKVRNLLCTGLDEMPIYINSPDTEVRAIAKWRLFIGK